MIVRPGISALCESPKAIEVQLPLKGCELGLPKVLGHDFIRELLWLSNNKGASMWEPTDQGLVVGFCSEHVHEFFWKCLRHPSRLFPDEAHGVLYSAVVMVNVRDTALLLPADVDVVLVVVVIFLVLLLWWLLLQLLIRTRWGLQRSCQRSYQRSSRKSMGHNVVMIRHKAQLLLLLLLLLLLFVLWICLLLRIR